MALVTERVHPRGLNFNNQRRVVILREQGMEYPDIATRVKNLEGNHPDARMCCNVYQKFNVRAGRVQTNYHKCGRKPWKLTKEVRLHLVRRLRLLRAHGMCTSTTLQQLLAREMHVTLDTSTIRAALRQEGYKWLPRSKKRKYNTDDRKARMQFARKVLAFSNAELRSHLAMCMDGVILAIPPADLTDRLNFLRSAETHCWRKPSEGGLPELDAHDPYKDQVPPVRAVPMWAGISGDGVAIVTFHDKKKITCEEWVKAVQAGKLRDALAAINPNNRRGPWTVLCDNEGFMKSTASTRAHTASRVQLWHIPRRSPDLNPVEKFWSWLRKQLRALDLRDAVAKRPVLGKTAYRARVRAVCKSARAQQKAANIANGLKKVCKVVLAKKGAASGG